jgi:demethylspheroidene O-methyltransferase
MYDSFGENLEAWVRGEPWKTRKRDEESILKFGLAMQAMGTGVARQVKAALDLRGAKKMLDVGGGLGHYSKALLGEYPELISTVLDTPEVVKMGRKDAVGTPLEDRIEFIGGDYLEDDWGTGYDFVLLANVLHQELSESAASMVRKGADAVCNGGRVGVVDFSIDDQQREHVLGSLFAINMRSFGDTYPEPTIRGWMERSGLCKVERIDLSDFRWLIIGHKDKE